MVAPNSNNESVRYDIQIEAEAAVKSLRDLIAQVETVPEKVKVFTKALQLMSQKLNVDWRTLLATFRQLNAEMSRQHQATIFGNVGGQPVFDMSAQYMQAQEGAAKATDATKTYNKELENTENSSRRAVRGLDAVRIAMGAIVAMIVFQAIQALQNFFREAIQGASDLEMGLYRLAKVERTLSKEGIAISPAGLAQGIKEIKELFSFLSTVDITQLLGSVSLLTKSLHLTEQQIIDLSKNIIQLNINSTQTESVMQTTDRVITSMITGKAQGVADLGLAFGDLALEAKAVELGFLKAGESASKLTAIQKTQVKLAIIADTAELQDTAQATQDIAKYMSTLEGQTNATKGAWEDFTAAIGTQFAPLIKSVLFGTLRFVQGIHAALIAIQPILNSMIAFLITGIKQFQAGIEIMLTGNISGGPLLGFFEQMRKELDAMQTGVENFGQAADTATAPIDKLAESLANVQAALETVKLDDLLKDLEDFQKKAEQLEQDFKTKMTRMEDDYQRDKDRAEYDHAVDRQRVIEDFALKRKEAEQKYRDKEKDAEARFQEQMRQLREKFLFNLEDALHERDARQVLRLIRQYDMDKTALTNEEALRKKSAVREHQLEMERLRQDEADRLRQMDEEFALKQARAKEDYDLKVARENEEHQKDMDDLKARIDERLMEFAKALADELGLKEGGAQTIYDMLQKYYGAGGFFDKLYDYSAESLKAKTQGLIEELAGLAAQAEQILAQLLGGITRIGGGKLIIGGGIGGGRRYPQPLPPGLGFQKNPIGRGKADVLGVGTTIKPAFLPASATGGSAFSSGGFTGREGGGAVDISLMLSPDLEAKIVNNTLDQAANIVARVVRSK